MQPVTVVLRSRRQRRAAAMQKLQHPLPAIILLGDGFAAVARRAEGVELAIAVLAIVSGALFVMATARGVRGALRRRSIAESHPHGGIEWADVFAAGVVFAETVERYHRTGHIVRPNVLMIVVLLTMAVFHGRIFGFAERRRALRISDEGLSVGGRPFRRAMRAAWDEIRSIEVTDRFASIRMTNGRSKRLDLNDLENAEAVRAALASARERLTE